MSAPAGELGVAGSQTPEAGRAAVALVPASPGPARQAGPAATCRRKAVGFIYTKSSRWSLPCMDEKLAGRNVAEGGNKRRPAPDRNL